MSNPRRGLGRGLEALIPSSPAEAEESGLQEVEGARFAEIPLGQIVAEPAPAAHGLRRGRRWPSSCTPSRRSVCSSRSSCARPAPDTYELDHGGAALARAPEGRPGHDRRRSSATPTDEDLLRDALLENLHRSQLNPLEEAAAYQQLLEDFGCTHEELAERIGRSRPQISNTLRLLKLPPAVQRRVAAGVLSAGHARALVAVPQPRDPGPAGPARRRRGPLGARPGGDRDGRPDERAPTGPTAGSCPRVHSPRVAELAAPPLRALRHPGQGRPRPVQGQDHRRVRHGRGPRADRRADGPGCPDTE